jgi:5-formyltetrahydrofolate cyclo-ligase
MTKQELRNLYRKLRDNVPDSTKQVASAHFTTEVLHLCEKTACKLLLCFSTFGSEIATAPLMTSARKKGIITALPVSEPETRTLRFFEVADKTPLWRGYASILEPDPYSAVEITDFSEVLCIVPALACTESGHRLGYGAGFYDRFLALHNITETACFCYEECILETEDVFEEHDIKIKYVITENRSVKEVEKCETMTNSADMETETEQETETNTELEQETETTKASI